MQENKQNNKFRPWEIVLLVILTPIIFVLGYMSLGTLFVGSVGLLIPEWLFTIWGGLTILGLDALWIIITSKFWPHGKVKSKIILTVLVLTVSAAYRLFVHIDDSGSKVMYKEDYTANYGS